MGRALYLSQFGGRRAARVDIWKGEAHRRARLLHSIAPALVLSRTKKKSTPLGSGVLGRTQPQVRTVDEAGGWGRVSRLRVRTTSSCSTKHNPKPDERRTVRRARQPPTTATSRSISISSLQTRQTRPAQLKNGTWIGGDHFHRLASFPGTRHAGSITLLLIMPCGCLLHTHTHSSV